MAARKWLKEDVAALARAAKSRAEFRRQHPNAFNAVFRYGWTDVLSHLPKQTRWTKPDVVLAAKPFRTRRQFDLGNHNAYVAAVNHGWIDEVCSHMERGGNRHKRFVYRIWDDTRRLVYVGISYDWRSRYDRHKSRPSPNLRDLLSGPHLVEALTDAIDALDAAKAEAEAIASFRSHGWTVANVAKAGNTGGNIRKWTVSALENEAALFATRGEMCSKSVSAYSAAVSLGLLDRIFANHPNRGYADGRPSRWRFWTETTVSESAASCRDLADFRTNHRPAYYAARRLRLIEKLFPGQQVVRSARARRSAAAK